MDAQYACSVWFDHDPPMAELRQRAEIEFDYGASAGQLVSVDPALQIVHEHFDIEFVIIHLTTRPSHPPLSKTKDDWLQFLGGSGRMIFDSSLIWYRLAHDKTGLLQLIQTFG